MNKTTRLIRLQRVVIAVLLATSSYACLKASNEKTEHQYAQLYKRQVEAGYEREATDQQTITDLDEQLKKYEARYGKIDAQHSAQSVYITRNPDGTLTTR